MTASQAKRAVLFALVVLLPLSGALRGASAQSSHPAAKAKSRRTSAPDTGSIKDGVYRNPSFGFSYKIPFGWVDRTEVMQQGDAADKTAQPSKSQVLLAVFERPPEAPRTAVNSGVVIALESASAYPGLKAAVDYFGPLEQVTTSKGFAVVNDPYEFPVGAKSVAREDFSKEAGKETGAMTMHQTCLVVLQKGYIVLFTFISDSDDDMDELLEGLSFESPPAPSRSRSAPARK